MKILHIDTGTAWRGGQRQVLTLHRGLIKHEIESVLLCNRKGKLYNKCLTEETPNCEGFDFLGELSKKTKQQIEQLITTHKPDLVHCHDSHSVSLGGRFYKKLPIFHTRRVSYPIKWLSRLLKYRKVDLHICVSEDIRRYMKQFFDHTTTIHSCIDLKRFIKKPIPSTLNNPFQKNILYVGAFTNQKGIDILIQSFARIHSQHPDTKLHLVGDGELFQQMKDLVSTLSIQNYTELYGTRDDVEDFYLASDIVVCPSVSGEGSSGVIKEGLAAGKTVIASALECNKELIDNNIDGILFSNDTQLDKALQHSLDEESIISEDRIKSKIKQFDCSRTIRKHIDTYNQYLKKYKVATKN